MLSRLFLLKNKKCCGEGCLMCPYVPKHHKDSILIDEKILKDLTQEELLDEKPAFDSLALKTLNWVSDFYIHSRGEVFSNFLPIFFSSSSE